MPSLFILLVLYARLRAAYRGSSLEGIKNALMLRGSGWDADAHRRSRGIYPLMSTNRSPLPPLRYSVLKGGG